VLLGCSLYASAAVDAMAAYAGSFAAFHHRADIAEDVVIFGLRPKVYFKIAQQIVSRHEVIRVREAR
jgi:hypothetical protein